MAAGRVNQGRHPGMPGFHGQMPGTALSGSETDVSTSTENLTQVKICLNMVRPFSERGCKYHLVPAAALIEVSGFISFPFPRH